MTFEPIEHDRDDYEPDDAPARPSAGRTGALWRRFWRSLTGQRDVVPAAALPLHAKQLRAEREPLRDEYGIRADFLDTTTAEFTVADNLGDALRALDEFDARHGWRVVKRTPIQRPVGEWREIGDDRG